MRVRAKRLGWDQRAGAISALDEYDPPAWVDAGADEVVEGELMERVVPADEVYRERRVCTVDGQLVDPDTVEVLE